MTNLLTAYQNKIFLADGERFAPFVTKALARPCPSAADVRAAHREWMTLAQTAGERAVQGTGQTDVAELEYEYLDSTGTTARTEAPKAIRATKGKVGIIPIMGPVDQRMSSELEKAGGTPLTFVSAALDSLLGNASVGCIVLQFNSPGGSVDGVQELSDRIYAARQQKPIYAIADSLAASASLWLATSATMFVSTPGGGGGTVGSHGVYVMHIDRTAAAEMEGAKVTTVYAGRHKTEFSPYSELTPEARVEMQARVDDIYDSFTSALARNRGTSVDDVRKNYGQGRVLTAQRALQVGMIDRILTMNQLMDKLTGGVVEAGGNGRAAASVDIARISISKARRERAD